MTIGLTAEQRRAFIFRNDLAQGRLWQVWANRTRIQQTLNGMSCNPRIRILSPESAAPYVGFEQFLRVYEVRILKLPSIVPSLISTSVSWEIREGSTIVPCVCRDVREMQSQDIAWLVYLQAS